MAFFDKVYPFTTEKIAGYMKHMDVKDKSVLTVGSSMDQALNACLYGSKDITVMDISDKTQEYMYHKLNLISKCDTTDKLYMAVADTDRYYLSKEELFGLPALRDMCPYLKDEESYHRLKENLKGTDFNFINGDIFDMDSHLRKQYDRMILSNVLQYMEIYRGEQDIKDFMVQNFINFRRYLSDEGIIQLMYIYGYCSNNHYLGFSTMDLVNALKEYQLEVVKFKSGALNDAVIMHTKKVR